MKYIISILAIIVCSSFTICQKMVCKDGKKWWTMYIYPSCADTTTYIELEYYTREAYKDKKIGEKEWTEHKQGVAVSERVYIKRVSKYSSDFHTGDYTSYSEKTLLNADKNEYESVRSFGHPSDRIIQVNDSMQMYLTYFKGGTVRRCELANRNQYHKTEVVEWDSTYAYRWQGNLELVAEHDRLDTIVYDDHSAQYRVVILDSTRKVGVWKKYDNFTGALLDSVDHK
ncbi:hypothetical protein [Flavipsychrobacter stenotrophus]|nr:hypothetical protein [Flavipsychrobacter stenotrophus]